MVNNYLNIDEKANGVHNSVGFLLCDYINHRFYKINRLIKHIITFLVLRHFKW